MKPPPNAIVVHPPHGWVALEACDASDLAVVNAARVSFDQRSDEMDVAEAGLVNFLMKNRHTSPFEHGMFRFIVRAPIFVLREWQRHRTWSYNEQSTRYVKMEPDFYVPALNAIRTQVGKPGHYHYEPLPYERADLVRDLMLEANSQAWATYSGMLAVGVAREVARNVLPLSLYSCMWATVDPLNLMRFLSLRNHSSALREIREYAEVLEAMFAKAMPVTHKAFVENGRLGMGQA